MLKDLVSKIARLAAPAIGSDIRKTVNTVASEVSKEYKTFTFSALPANVEELKVLPESSLKDPFAVAALGVLALMPWEKDRETSLAMLEFLRGPGGPLSPMERQNIADRFMDGKFYKVRSFFDGATPENDYTPGIPYSVKVFSNKYSYPAEDRATLYLTSGGADSPRPVSLRKKPSTGQWFITQLDILSDIRIPASQDKWK